MQRCKDVRREYQRIYREVRNRGTVGQAYVAAGYLDAEVRAAYNDLIQLLPNEENMLLGDATELEKAFEFLETDILAFRTGYWKAEIFTKLKHVMLPLLFSSRVRDLALTYVRWTGYRREYYQLCRLTILHADAALVLELDKICSDAAEKDQLKKARSLLYRILNSRQDLRAIVPLEKVKL